MAAKKITPQTQLEVLRESEALLRRTLLDAEPANVAALARELRATVADIAVLEADTTPEIDIVDILAKRRAAKPAADSASANPRKGQPRRRSGEHRAS